MKSLASGRELTLIPGPSILPDRVLNAMHQANIDIYAGAMEHVTENIISGLKKIFNTKANLYLYPANGHGAWEAAITNVLSRGDKILVLESGRFATGWGEMAKFHDVDVEILPGSWQEAVDLEKVSERLAADKQGDIKAILIVQVDTATGCKNDIGQLRKVIDETGHGGMLFVDAVASLATMPFLFDEWGVDVAVAGAQKALMAPPGMSFTAVSARARSAHESADLRSMYWDWTSREGELHYLKYCGTMPEQLLFGLNEALDMLFEEGMESIFYRHLKIADATRAAIDAWQVAGASHYVHASSARSNAVSVVAFDDDMVPDILNHCRTYSGVTLGNGIDKLHNRCIRIGHMGHVNVPTILGALGAIDIALLSMGKKLDQTGVDAAAKELSKQ